MNRAWSLLSRCYFSSILALQHPLLLTGSPEASLSPKGLLAFFLACRQRKCRLADGFLARQADFLFGDCVPAVKFRRR